MLISDEKYSELSQKVKEYIDKKCIVRDTIMIGKEPKTFYSWMFYIRRGLFNHEFLTNASKLFIYKIERIYPDFNFQVSGLETAATPFMIGISLTLKSYDVDVNCFVVRQEQKKYGLLNWIEGLPNEKPVIIVDDLCNSSASMAKCYKILKEHKIEVLPYAFALVNKSNKGIHSEHRLNSDMYLPDAVNVLSPFTLDDFNLSNPSH